MTFHTLTGRSVAEDETRPVSSMPPCGRSCPPWGCMARDCPVNQDEQPPSLCSRGCQAEAVSEGLCAAHLEQLLDERPGVDFDPGRDEW